MSILVQNSLVPFTMIRSLLFSCWFHFSLHSMVTSVMPCLMIMPVHLLHENYTAYNPTANMAQILSDPFFRRIMLIEWFICNRNNQSARSLTYCQFPSTKQARKGNIGHLYCGHPSTTKIVQVIILDDGEIEYKTIDSIFNHLYGANNI
jgi:hypothetical protein